MKSRRPYLVRALYEWIADNNSTPYLLVHADTAGVDVPLEFVNEGRIVLNVAQGAVRDLVMDNDLICFSARFAGKPRSVSIPVRAVLAIYAKENGQGMFFDGVDDEPLAAQPQMAQREKPTKTILRLVK
ncbi:MAG: ClpXP protease specificity-enhancing factor [Gammaproteobacteria bacterium]|nr:ClpXP protease specificity-enhancing factor [Gammaproteobacteria bacterium]